MNVSRQFFFSCCCFVGVYISNFNGRACAQFRQTQFRKSSSKFIFQYFHYFFIMPPTPKSAKAGGCCCCCWELLGGTTFEKGTLYLCTKKFGASNLSQFWRLKALFIIILALNALFICQFWRRRRFVLSVLAPKALCIVSFGAEGALYCISNFDLGESKQYCSCN